MFAPTKNNFMNELKARINKQKRVYKLLDRRLLLCGANQKPISDVLVEG